MERKNDRRVIHLDTRRGFPQALCGKSLHGWQGVHTPRSSADRRDVTCKACRKAMAAA